MFHRLKIRLRHFWQTRILKKSPIQADIFIAWTYNKEERTTIYHKPWVEIQSLWEKSRSWESFVVDCGPKVGYPIFLNMKAGWKEIKYG